MPIISNVTCEAPTVFRDNSGSVLPRTLVDLAVTATVTFSDEEVANNQRFNLSIDILEHDGVGDAQARPYWWWYGWTPRVLYRFNWDRPGVFPRSTTERIIRATEDPLEIDESRQPRRSLLDEDPGVEYTGFPWPYSNPHDDEVKARVTLTNAVSSAVAKVGFDRFDWPDPPQ